MIDLMRKYPDLGDLPDGRVIIMHHVFADQRDEATSDPAEAARIFEGMCQEYDDVRWYACIEDEDGGTIDESLIAAKGDYPW